MAARAQRTPFLSVASRALPMARPPEASRRSARTEGSSGLGLPAPLDDDLVLRAARAALVQRRRGDRRPLRVLYEATFSFLRYFHHRWELSAA